MSQLIVCPTCKGAKEVPKRDVKITLPWFGTKQLYKTFVVCPTCNGKGGVKIDA